MHVCALCVDKSIAAQDFIAVNTKIFAFCLIFWLVSNQSILYRLHIMLQGQKFCREEAHNCES